ncbi:uncharacterized protein [Ciconia boyciana]|uniref:uncharacterized protein n=1 Tax=Ciconia boyciana TaxID=52775 RepID=UPI003BA3188E
MEQFLHKESKENFLAHKTGSPRQLQPGQRAVTQPEHGRGTDVPGTGRDKRRRNETESALFLPSPPSPDPAQGPAPPARRQPRGRGSAPAALPALPGRSRRRARGAPDVSPRHRRRKRPDAAAASSGESASGAGARPAPPRSPARPPAAGGQSAREDAPPLTPPGSERRRDWKGAVALRGGLLLPAPPPARRASVSQQRFSSQLLVLKDTPRKTLGLARNGHRRLIQGLITGPALQSQSAQANKPPSKPCKFSTRSSSSSSNCTRRMSRPPAFKCVHLGVALGVDDSAVAASSRPKYLLRNKESETVETLELGKERENRTQKEILKKSKKIKVQEEETLKKKRIQCRKSNFILLCQYGRCSAISRKAGLHHA